MALKMQNYSKIDLHTATAKGYNMAGNISAKYTLQHTGKDNPECLDTHCKWELVS